MKVKATMSQGSNLAGLPDKTHPPTGPPQVHKRLIHRP